MTQKTVPEPRIYSDFTQRSVVDPPTDPLEYDAWFRAKVQEALDDPQPSLSNEEVQKYFAKKRTATREKIRNGTVD